MDTPFTEVAMKIAQRVEEMLLLLTELEAERTIIASRFDAKIAALTKDRDDALREPDKLLAGHVAKIVAYCEKHRATLTKDKKSIKLPHGKLMWRTRPPAVLVEDEEAVITTLLKKGYDQFVRTIYQVDKNEVLKDTSITNRIPGLAIRPGTEQLTIETDTNKYIARDPA